MQPTSDILFESKTLERFPDRARVWIYTTSRQLTDEEASRLKSEGNAFVAEWLVHGRQLDAGFDVLFSRFPVFIVDEAVNEISGCGIDSSVKFLMQMENTLGIKMLDKTMLAYRDGKGNIRAVPMNRFTGLIDEGVIDENTLVFNNLVETFGQMRRGWQVPLHRSWHKQLLR